MQCVQNMISRMSKLTVQQIKSLARSLIAQHPGGIRYGVLVDKISEQSPETPKNTIHGSVWNLDALFPDEVAKPSRGLFTPATSQGINGVPVTESTEQIAETGARVQESDFYQPFAQWLKNDLDEVTEVAPLGGAGLKSKWGTPDVVGIYKPLASNLIKFPIEIVSAEIKIDPQAPVVAFGQAGRTVYFRRKHISECRPHSRKRIKVGLNPFVCCLAWDLSSSH